MEPPFKLRESVLWRSSRKSNGTIRTGKTSCVSADERESLFRRLYRRFRAAAARAVQSGARPSTTAEKGKVPGFPICRRVLFFCFKQKVNPLTLLYPRLISLERKF